MLFKKCGFVNGEGRILKIYNLYFRFGLDLSPQSLLPERAYL